MKRIIQLHNVLPFHLSVQHTQGLKTGQSMILPRKSKTNIELSSEDKFNITLSNDSKLVFLEDIDLEMVDSQSQSQSQTGTLILDETILKSWKGGEDEEPEQINLGFGDLVFRPFQSDGTKENTQEGSDVYVKPGQIFSIETQKTDGEYLNIGYLVAKTQKQEDEDSLACQIILKNAMFGKIEGGKYIVISGNSNFPQITLGGYTPDNFNADSSEINLHQGQIIYYDNAPKETKGSEKLSFQDGTAFILFDHDVADISASFTIIKDYFGEAVFNPEYIRLGYETSIDFYANDDFKGTKQTISSSSFYTNKLSHYGSFKLNHLISEAEAHMHIRCSLADGVQEKDDEPKIACEYRTTISLSRPGNLGGVIKFPKLQFELANLSDENQPQHIYVNGKKYTFDEKTNQTEYIQPSHLGKITASLPLTSHQIGTPQLYIRSEAMPAHTFVVVDPAIEMRERMAHMVDSKNQPVSNFIEFVKDKAKQGLDGGIELNDEVAEKVKNVTQHLYKTVVNSHRHTASGNNTHHFLEGRHLKDQCDGIEFRQQKEVVSPDLTIHARDTATVNHAIDSLFASSKYGFQTVTLQSGQLGGWFGDIEHFIVTTADKVKKHLQEMTHEALDELKKVEHMVEHALAAVVKYASGKVELIILKTAEAIDRLATVIYKAIKIAAEDLVDFFKFLLKGFEDIKKFFDFTITNMDKTFGQFNNIKLGEDIIKKEVDPIIQKIKSALHIKDPNTANLKNKNGHKSSNQGGGKGEEKLHWILTLIFDEIFGDGEKGPNNFISEFFKEWEYEVEDDVLQIVTGKIRAAFSGDYPKQPKAFIEKLVDETKQDLENLPSVILKQGKGIIIDKLKKAVDDVTTNPFKQSLVPKDKDLPLFCQKIILLIKIAGFDEELGQGKVALTPANILALCYAIPGGIIYALGDFKPKPKNSVSASQELTDNSSTEATEEAMMKVSSIIAQITSTASATVTVMSCKEESPTLSGINAILACINTLNASIDLAFLVKEMVAPEKDSIATQIKQGLSIVLTIKAYAGILIMAAEEAAPESDLPVSQVLAIMDAVEGVLSIADGISDAALGEPPFGSISKILSGLGQVCEVTAALDPDPDSSAAIMGGMIFFDAVGGVFNVVSIIEE